MKISVKKVGFADFRVQRLCCTKRNFVSDKKQVRFMVY